MMIYCKAVSVHQHKLWLPQIKCEGTEWKVMVSSVRKCDKECGLVAFGQQSWWLNLRRESTASWLDPFTRPSITSHSGNICKEEELYHQWTLWNVWGVVWFLSCSFNSDKKQKTEWVINTCLKDSSKLWTIKCQPALMFVMLSTC